jgi:predicted peroxiredoxin
MRNLKKILLITGLVMSTFITGTQAQEKPSILTVVTSPDAQTQGMAFVLSIQSAQQGASVRVLLCGLAGGLALKGSAETKLKPKGMSPQMLMAKLIGQGATVEVCALYLPNAGKTPADLVDGIGVAKPPAIAAAMLAPDTRLFTF